VTDIPPDHPRYASLVLRERVVAGVAQGLVAPQGLIAHGRGEAFDYLLGERTTPPADLAARAAAARLLAARDPVLSVNGNTAVLVPGALADLQRALGCKVEVNLFHRTEARVEKLVAHLETAGCRDVLGRGATPTIPGLTSERAKSTREGIAGADCVLVPLEDGDRAQALRAMGKTVLTIDINPLSRTARSASVNVADNVVRALPNVTRHVEVWRKAGEAAWRKAASEPWDGEANMRAVLAVIAERARTEA